MLGRLKALRTNENILIAIGTLLYSKNVFALTFLMTYMIRMSLDGSPTNYLVYRIFSYVVMGGMAVVLIGVLKKYTLAAWRLGMVFAVVQVLAIMFMDTQSEWFVFLLALITGLESTLYHRPNSFFLVTEVRNDRRLRFQNIQQIFIEVSKIVMPVVLGILITDQGFSQAAVVILIISLVQVLLSLLFRPSREPHEHAHHLRAISRKILRNSLLRRVMYVQFLRGALVNGSAFLLIPTLLVYGFTGSDLDLGVYASLGSAIAIVMVLVFKFLKRRKIGSRVFLGIVTPLAIILPLVLVFWPTVGVAIAFYVFTVACCEGFLNMFLMMKILNWIKRQIGDHAYTLEVEAVSEVFLCAGRVASLVLLLGVSTVAGTGYLTWLAFGLGLLVIPIVFLSTRSLRED